jgi:hypothetical protein
MATPAKKSTGKAAVTGMFVVSVPGFVLVKDGSRKRSAKAPSSESASTLVPRVAQALSRPGISRDVVFKGKVKNAFSYSVDPTDTSRVVRVAADGSRSVGRLVKGRFVTVKAA